MSKDVAVVHWTDKGIDKLASVGTIQLLSQMIEFCEKKGFTYYVCLTKIDTIIPVRSQKPSQAFNVPTEYKDKGAPRFEPHRAFSEAVNGARHPPVTIEKRDKAYKNHI